MNETTLLRDAGPEAPPLTPAARSAARAALLVEIDTASTVRGRVRARLPRRRTAIRVGAGVVAVVAAWSAAVVVAAPDDPGLPATSVRLVDFETPTFPLTLDPVPDGLRPQFDGDGDGASIAAYESTSGDDGFTVSVSDQEIDWSDEGVPGYRQLAEDEVQVGGQEADLVQYRLDVCTTDDGLDCPSETWTYVSLTWEQADHQWIRVVAHGRYATEREVMDIADSLLDRPQPAALQVGLAPEGWSVQFYKMGRVLTLVNDAYEQQTLTVQIPLPEDVVPDDQLVASLMGPVGPMVPVTVHGLPAALVPVDQGGPDGRGWFLQARFGDGTVFQLQVPGAFTQDQVLEFAEQVTHNP